MLGLVALLAVPFPRQSAPLSARVTTAPVGPEHRVVDRFGVPATEQDVEVEVALSRPDGARGADWFTVTAWQGGGDRTVPLAEIAPGRYRSTQPVPTGGSWKAMVFLARGSRLEAVPVAFPPDPSSHFAGYPLETERDAAFQPSGNLLMTEAHGGAPWVATVAYVALGATVTLWIALLVLAHRAVARGRASMEG